MLNGVEGEMRGEGWEASKLLSKVKKKSPREEGRKVMLLDAAVPPHSRSSGPRFSLSLSLPQIPGIGRQSPLIRKSSRRKGGKEASQLLSFYYLVQSNRIKWERSGATTIFQARPGFSLLRG